MREILIQQLQSRLDYCFSDLKHLELALTHRSAGIVNNERLEFLGDSLLNFFIAEALFKRFPSAKEGRLSGFRADLVKGETLAIIAREFNLGEYLQLGDGERKSGGQRRSSILADAVEAIIGAIYLDAGLDACGVWVLSCYQERLDSLDLARSVKDAKTRLQEYLQSCGEPLPSYQIVSAKGEAHAQLFTVECKVSLLKKPASAQARNRREAEKQSAEIILSRLNIQ